MRKTAIIAALLVALGLSLSGLFDNEAMYGKIHADAQGYYGYLVAVFLEQSFDWEQVIHSYADVYFGGGGSDFTVQSDLGRINKYYAGASLLMLPFFLVSCLCAWLFGFPIDGYSAPFQFGVMVGALFYVGVGLYFLSRFLEARGISKGVSIFTVLCCFFATGLFHYSVSEPAMSHAYSFGLVSVFMFTVDRWLTSDNSVDLLVSSLVFGLIVLVRPVNGLVILSVPFIAGGLKPLLEKLKGKGRLIKKLGLGVLVVFGVLLIQSGMYLAQVGEPLVWSYQDEGFNFSNPKIWNVLFSYKKGFFIYTPIGLLAAAGLVFHLVKKPKEGVWLWLFLAVTVYVISSWWNWYYGGSFGMRALIEFLPFAAFGLAFLIQSVGKPLRVFVGIACLFFVSVNLIQSYQYQKFILHWVGMDEARYWEVFLKTDREYDGIFYRRDMTLSTTVFETDLELGFKWGNQGLDSTQAFSGTRSTVVGGGNPYGSTFSIPVSELGEDGNRQIHFSAMVYCEKPMQELKLAYSFRNDSTDYGHDYIELGHLVVEANKWMKVTKIEKLKKPVSVNDLWVVYPFSGGETKVYLDDLKYEIVTLRE